MKHLLVLLSICLTLVTNAQTAVAPLSVEAILEIAYDGSEPPMVMDDGEMSEADSLVMDEMEEMITDYRVIAMIELDDVSVVSTITLTLTSSESQLLQETITIDDSSSLPEGMTYNREESVVYIGLGTYTGLESFELDCYLTDTDGNNSATVRYSLEE